MVAKQTTTGKVISRDGTPIAFEQCGDGTPVLLVHGTGADHTRWGLVLPLLAQSFSVTCIDRRGRGASGDAPEYSAECEFADIAAVASSLPGPVDVLGHSFGAACVLGAAPQIPNLRRLILYEPPMLHEQQLPQRSALLDRMDQALADGDRESVVLTLMRDMLRVPQAIIDRARGTPAWAGQLAAAHTIPRELRASDRYAADRAALKAILAPTLFLLGSDSPQSFKDTTAALSELLPNSQVAILAGQQHSAMLTAPDLFAAEVIRFLNA